MNRVAIYTFDKYLHQLKQKQNANILQNKQTKHKKSHLFLCKRTKYQIDMNCLVTSVDWAAAAVTVVTIIVSIFGYSVSMFCVPFSDYQELIIYLYALCKCTHSSFHRYRSALLLFCRLPFVDTLCDFVICYFCRMNSFFFISLYFAIETRSLWIFI